jgi:hypothetical protein
MGLVPSISKWLKPGWDVAQRQRENLACMRPWFYPHHQKKTIVQSNYFTLVGFNLLLYKRGGKANPPLHIHTVALGFEPKAWHLLGRCSTA